MGRDGRYNRFVTRKVSQENCILLYNNDNSCNFNLVNSESICLVRLVCLRPWTRNRTGNFQADFRRTISNRPSKDSKTRRDEMTSKNLGRLFGRCRVTDGRLPTLVLILSTSYSTGKTRTWAEKSTVLTESTFIRQYCCTTPLTCKPKSGLSNSQNQHLLAVPPFAAVNPPENRTTTQSVNFLSGNQSADQENYSPIQEDTSKPLPKSHKSVPSSPTRSLVRLLQSWAWISNLTILKFSLRLLLV